MTNPWTPQNPEHEASPEQTAKRHVAYDRIAPRWNKARVSALGWNVKDAIFGLDHVTRQAVFVTRCHPEVTTAPYQGQNAMIVPTWDGNDERDVIGRELEILGSAAEGRGDRYVIVEAQR